MITDSMPSQLLWPLENGGEKVKKIAIDFPW